MFLAHLHATQVLDAIDAEVNNIAFRMDEESLKKYYGSFLPFSDNMHVLPGTVAAGDGVVFRMKRPTTASTTDKSSFFTRFVYISGELRLYIALVATPYVILYLCPNIPSIRLLLNVGKDTLDLACRDSVMATRASSTLLH